MLKPRIAFVTFFFQHVNTNVALATVTVNMLTLSIATANVSNNTITIGGLLKNIILDRFPHSIAVVKYKY